TPFAALWHHEGYTRGRTNPIEDLEMTARDIREMGFVEDPFFHPELHPDHVTPTLRLTGEPTAREALEIHTENLAPQKAKPLDLYDDVAIREAVSRLEDSLPIPASNRDEVGRCDWAAARFILQTIRSMPDLRARFPHALSDGPDGTYCRWLC